MKSLACGAIVLLSWFPAWSCARCSVALDVGHSWIAPGAISAHGRPEFQFNLALAVAIRRALRERDCSVELIAAGGDVTDLRARTALSGDAALFLSVHHDSVHADLLEFWQYTAQTLRFNDHFGGFSLFVSRDNPDLAGSLSCASEIGAALRRHRQTPSRYHADPIVGEARAFLDEANGVHAYDRLVVLYTARQKAVLLEAGVLINRAEELRLLKRINREAIAEAVADGITVCLNPAPSAAGNDKK